MADRMSSWVGLRPTIGAAALLQIMICGPAVAQSLFDGEYWIEGTLTEILKGECTRPAPGSVRKLTIANSRVNYVYNPHFQYYTELNGSVDAAGNFTASGNLPSGAVQMVGRIQGQDLVANAQSPNCRYTFQGKRR